MPQYVGSKWRKTKAIMQHESLQHYVPRTVALNVNSLRTMLQHYGMVYIKPDKGSHGNGVIRIEKTNKIYRYQLNKRVREFNTYQALYHAIKMETRGTKYLVQKGIHLLTYNGRRFDLRIMVQLNPRRKWETTGIIGRVAAPRKIVTNYHSGGKLTPASRLIGKHVSKAALPTKLRSLHQLGVKAGKVMHRAFPGIRAIGLDIGMDHSLTPWILEINTRPDPYIFRQLADPAIYRKIRLYAKYYGKK